MTIPIPDTVQGVVTARIDRLSQEEKTLLQEASIVGKEFWIGAVAHLRGAPEPAVDEVLQRLQTRDLVVEQPKSQLEGQRELAFKHLLIRDMAYTLLPKRTRAEKHRAFALWLEKTFHERADEYAQIVAYHWMQAAQLDREVGRMTQWADVAAHALRWTLVAGRNAARIYANEQAIAHFQSAQTLAEQLGADRERIAAIEGLADVYAHRAQWEEASRLYRDALTYYLQEGDSVRQARVQSRIGSTFSGIFDFRQALPHIQSAMETLKEQKDERELTSVYLQMARAQTSMGNLREAEEFARLGLALATQQNVSPQIAEGHLVLGFIYTLPNRPEAPTYHTKGIEIAQEIGDSGRAIYGFHWSAYRHRLRGEYAEAIDGYSRAVGLARETNNRPRLAFAQYSLGHTLFLTGQWEAAAEAWGQYLAVSAEVPSWIEHTKSMLAFVGGDVPEALSWAQRGIGLGERRREITSIGLAIDWASVLLLRLSKPEEALRILRGALDRFVPMGVFWPAFLHPLAAEAALGINDVGAAAEHCQHAEVMKWIELRPARARLLKAKGLVETIRGAHNEALQLLTESGTLYRQLGQPYDLALVLEALAEVLAQRNAPEERTRRTEALQEASRIYRQLGAKIDAARISPLVGSDEAVP